MNDVSAWILVILIRLIVPISILRYPVRGSIISLICEICDMGMLQLLGVTDFSEYQRIDKALDTYMYFFQGCSMVQWENVKAKLIGVSLLFYRVVGVIAFEVTRDRSMLLVFPDVFIFYFMFYVLYKRAYHRDPFIALRPTFSILIILTAVKLCQEYLLHIIEFPFHHFIVFPFGPGRVLAGK